MRFLTSRELEKQMKEHKIQVEHSFQARHRVLETLRRKQKDSELSMDQMVELLSVGELRKAVQSIRNLPVDEEDVPTMRQLLRNHLQDHNVPFPKE